MCKSYAGIGSRETPDYIEHLMSRIGQYYAICGYTLRSGGANGADSAFEAGCDLFGGSKEIYLPWKGFNNNTSQLWGVSSEAKELASRYHPNWDACSHGAKMLLSRNGYQILGPSLKDPVNEVICWTSDGKYSGGTGQALRLAADWNIPIHNLHCPETFTFWTRVCEYQEALLEKVKMEHFIHYRESLVEDDELLQMNINFMTAPTLQDLKDLVNPEEAELDDPVIIPRYTIMPYLVDQYREMESAGFKPINDLKAIQWIADIREWAPVLGDMTPQTWCCPFREIPYEGPFVLKGLVNSRKDKWNSHMFAANKQEASAVMANLCDDSLIGPQGIVLRKYEPLVKLEMGINGLPITKEFRLFIYKQRILAYGFYWHNYIDDLDTSSIKMDVPYSFLEEAMERVASIKHPPNFYVMDIAQKQDGRWTVIELNSGEMSGLACVDPKVLYSQLKCQLGVC